MNQNNFKNITMAKIIRAIILFISIYFVMKYFTIGKIPYTEICMIGCTAVLVQTLLDIYRPIIVINQNVEDSDQ